MNDALPAALAVLLALSGCTAIPGLGGNETAGLVSARVVEDTPDGASPVPLSDVENEYIREAVTQAVENAVTDGRQPTANLPYPRKDKRAVLRAHDRIESGERGSAYVRHRNRTVLVEIAVQT